MELPKRYDSDESEKKWTEYWEKEKIYRFEPKSKKPVYSIDVPPPYASAGHLHIGHALHYTQFEIIARYKRMKGFNVYFAPCFDNNGLPTEKYVEEKFNISKDSTTRVEFRKLCREESARVEKAYAEKVFKALGHSYDWSLLYTTIDPEAQKVAQTSFLELVKKGDCYRGEEPTIWCTKHQTALAQAEVEDLSRTTKLSYAHFDLEDGNKIEIATTRPEFLPACVGVFIHPKDRRYRNLAGKKAIVPLFKQEVPVMEDEKVDMDFGSGIVMICTFGDTTDIDWWKRFKLPLRICVTKEGKLNELGGKFKGLSLEEARKAIIEELDKEGRLVKQENLQQTVGSCWRCNTPVEFIVTKQWFIKTLRYKDELIKQGRKIKWYPSFYRARYEDWTTNLAWDWCISRQRYYGVPIPVWYCKKCGKEVFPDKKDLPVDPTDKKPKKPCSCGSNEFIPEYDVFDTWMTSSMSPEIAVRWLEKPDKFKKMFPTSLRPQSHDIIRTWAFYTILKAYLHFNEIPWRDIAIGTFVLDSKGKGMHKSKGNVIWTGDLLAKYNTDNVRYWVGKATFGEDLAYQEKDLIEGNRFITKLWNASKFAFMHLDAYNLKEPKELEIMDKWILSRLSALVKETTENFDNYKTGEVTRKTENFFWHEFCDNYLEIIKDRLYTEERGKEGRLSAQYALYHALLTIIKLMAPITPYITEELYQLYYKKHEKIKSVHISKWPSLDIADDEAERIGDFFIYVLQHVRRAKSEKNLSLKKPVRKIVAKGKITKKDFEKIRQDLTAATAAEEIIFEQLSKDSKIDYEVVVEI
ncbi:valine--tRNA ligase [Candidatus Woesearchaeota archaeon]|nr:valine--tRNA ligase [Candidatus Woesearchaeota archaeon]